MSEPDTGQRARRKRRRRPFAASESTPQPRQLSGIVGGRYRPLNEADLPVVDQAARKILQDIGMSEAPAIVFEQVTAAGGPRRFLFLNCSQFFCDWVKLGRLSTHEPYVYV